MKNRTYLFAFVFLISLFSCEEEDSKNMNITNPEQDINIKELVGDLTSHIVITNLLGESIAEVDMGETFYVIDNTAGGATSRSWTITQGSNTISSEDQLVRVNFAKPGKATINLTSKRMSDGKSVTSSVDVNIKNIPVTASFISDPAGNGAIVNILQGASVGFTTEVSGSPTLFEWTIKGPETLTSNEQNPTVKFTEVGTYNITFIASRDDGEAGISEAVVEKSGYVVVGERVLELVRAVGTDNKIELQYNHPVAQTLGADVVNEFSVTINTAKGAALNPEIFSVTATGEKTLEIKFDGNMFSDDELLVTYNPSGQIKDATDVVVPQAVDADPCVYGKAMAIGDTEDESNWQKSTGTASTNGFFKFVDENSTEYAMKPYQGQSCIAIVRGDDKIGVSMLSGYDVAEGDVFEFAYEALSTASINGALERRMSTVAGDGGNGAGGNWMSAGKNGNATGEWTTVKKTINVSTNTKGVTGTLYFHFFRYGGSNETDAIWIDNFRIYKPNPRP